ncbi:MAG TPA: hypothetical protein DCS23_01565 [Candidatus Yonathbacteria bacterium]|nr:hypothetical protein [Candidatus Yonathbacteria bacterium]
MNTKNLKRVVLVVGVLGILFIAIFFPIGINCYNASSCPKVPSLFFGVIDIMNKTDHDLAFGLIFLTLPLLFLSLITYRMKDEVFHAWFNFAKWWVPIIIVVTLLLENAGGGGTLGMNKDLTFFILGILYTVFIVTSLVKIVRAYMKTRG